MNGRNIADLLRAAWRTRCCWRGRRNAEARGRAGEPGVRRQARAGSLAVVKNPSADRCLSLQLAAPFFMKSARSTSVFCSDLPREQPRRVTSALPDHLNRPTKEPDERDGADPS